MAEVIDMTARINGPTREEEQLPHDMQSWKPEVIADNSGKWTGNALRFATKEEAQRYVYDLALRWIAVRDTRVVPSDEPVNYRIIGNRVERIQ